MAERVNRQWRLAARPVGRVKQSDFEWRQEPVPAPGEGEVLVRNLYLSLDPTNRGWMTDRETYLPPVAIGDVMRGTTIGIVEESRNPKFPQGAIVQGLLGWQDYAISNGAGLNVLPNNPAIPLTAYFGLFGHIGLTAYFGLLDVGRPKAGETLVVSAAAGATG
ncbi:MAG TPA: NADP-dependent oxidoreductase, partial [Blastocatellia bacterium]|nr:NADP-dependent oxidoreductase [Blastocatellia bacterium]